MNDLLEYLDGRFASAAAFAGDDPCNCRQAIGGPCRSLPSCPAFVRRDAESKRRILALHVHRDFGRLNTQFCEICHDDDGNPAVVGVWCETVRLLALPYAAESDHEEGRRV